MTQTAVVLRDTTARPEPAPIGRGDTARVRLVPSAPRAYPIEVGPSVPATRPYVTAGTQQSGSSTSVPSPTDVPPTVIEHETARGHAAARRYCGRAHMPEVDPKMTSCLIAVAAVEVLAGLRPVAQLARWVSPQVYDQVSLRAAIQAEAGGRTEIPRGRPATRRVRMCRISDDIVEATVVVHHMERVRAVAVRLEMRRGRWRAEALVVG